jgi:hypothetical protein
MLKFLPKEMIITIAIFLNHPSDILKLAITSHFFQQLLKENNILWKSLIDIHFNEMKKNGAKNISFSSQFHQYQSLFFAAKTIDINNAQFINPIMTTNNISLSTHRLLFQYIRFNELDKIKKLPCLVKYIFAEAACYPVAFASTLKRREILDYFYEICEELTLTELEATTNYHLIHCAAACGKLTELRQLVSQNHDLIHQTGKKNETPLYMAVYNRHINVVKYLLALNANVNACSINGTTPLAIAIKNEDFDIIKLLIENQANPFARHSNGTTIRNLVSGANPSIKYYFENIYRNLEEKTAHQTRQILKIR